MRDVIVVTILCLIAATVADFVWSGGKHVDAIKQELGLEISSVGRR